MVKQKNVKWYGYRPDTMDVRDLRFKAPSGALPSKVDLRPGFSPVYDQGSLGSCTANAIAGAMEFDMLKQKEASFSPSRLFIYYNERVMEGTIKEDAGAEIRDGIKSVNIVGAPNENLWPYRIGRFAAKPPRPAYTQAKQHKSVLYQRIDSTKLSDLKACLAAGFPFVFGFSVYADFESPRVASTGKVNLPKKGESLVGGHAVVAAGYDDAAGRFTVRNSWAADWGIGGYFTIPYGYLTNLNLADDFWKISQVQ
jgi:C1A family cysteine protease